MTTIRRVRWPVARFVLALVLAAAGCEQDDGGEPADKAGGAAAVVPVVPASSKADVLSRVAALGPLGFGANGAVVATFAEDFEFHGWAIETRAGAVVTIEVTQKGSNRSLDTTLFLYGPRTEAGGYGTSAVAKDDDSGWGRLSRLKSLALPQGGRYLVVVGTHDGTGRGTYRLEARCESGECGPVAPAAGCAPEILAALEKCVEDRAADPDHDPYTVSRLDLLDLCADPEPIAPAWDAMCEKPGAPADQCEIPLEEFASKHLPVCRREATHRLLDASCVFGRVFRDLDDHPDAVVVVWRRVLTAATPLTSLEEAQVVTAVHATAYDDVTTAAGAFEAVDSGEINQVEVWDASGRRAYTAYEMGAGDNSFGMYFEHGTTRQVARINDSDIYDCTVTWGRERRPCATDDDCLAGTNCTGVPADLPRGRCIDATLDTHPAITSSCTGEAGCPAGSGLLCAGGIGGGDGTCVPGWMRGRFSAKIDTPVPDDDPNGAEATLLVWGLATVSTDVAIDLHVGHPRPSDLVVTLVNPAGTEVTVVDGSAAGAELYLDGKPLAGFPGDESANGVWRLRVRDGKKGKTGTAYSFGLTVTSRWD